MGNGGPELTSISAHTGFRSLSSTLFVNVRNLPLSVDSASAKPPSARISLYVLPARFALTRNSSLAARSAPRGRQGSGAAFLQALGSGVGLQVRALSFLWRGCLRALGRGLRPFGVFLLWGLFRGLGVVAVYGATWGGTASMTGLGDVLYLGQPGDIHSSAEWKDMNEELGLLDSLFTSGLPSSSMMHPAPVNSGPLSGLGDTYMSDHSPTDKSDAAWPSCAANTSVGSHWKGRGGGSTVYGI